MTWVKQLSHDNKAEFTAIRASKGATRKKEQEGESVVYHKNVSSFFPNPRNGLSVLLTSTGDLIHFVLKYPSRMTKSLSLFKVLKTNEETAL